MKDSRLWWLPNGITAARGACGPAVLVLLVGFGASWVAFWVFLVAMASDMLDGWLARLLDCRSDAALFLDPLADKLLTACTWAGLWGIGYAPTLLAGVFVARALLIGVAWGWAAPRKLAWSPRPAGQISLAFEGIALCVLLFHGPWLGVHWPTVGATLGTLSFALSLLPLADYASHGPERRP
jgi:phosphatidylglycerophosphate synthase